MENSIDNINDFRRNFYSKYHSIVVPTIAKYEKERKIKLFWAITLSILLILGGIIYLYAIYKFEIDGKDSAKPGFYMIIFGCFMYSFFKKDFENKLKSKIMDTVTACFGNMKWSAYYPKEKAELFVRAGLFKRFTSADNDDVFTGTYKDVKIDIVEAEYAVGSGKNRTVVFDGLCIKLDMNKKFKGHTLLTKDTLLHKSPLSRLRHTQLEDVQFEKKYDVFTDDEVEARYILTPKLMEKLTRIQTAFHCKSISCAFLNEKLIIAMQTTQDLFSIGSLVKPVTDPKQFQTLCDQFISVLQLIDHLELDKRAVL